MVLSCDKALEFRICDDCLQSFGVRHVHRHRNVVVVDNPTGTDSPRDFVGDQTLGDRGSGTYVRNLVGAMSFLDTGSLRCMLSGSVFMEVLPRDTLLLVAKGGQLKDQLLLGSHVLF
nr:hypothetical protein ANI_1_1184024 [Aspergillus niger CBS 513.88]|eukprot:XP_003188589.1 hypothetical protein ANI_1_1184024 [Aspergillus niger CBS 513.88]